LNAAFDESGIWRSRQALSLAAPHHVVAFAIKASRAIEAMKDVLINDGDTEGSAYDLARRQLWEINAELREAMRQDLGIPGPPDPELLAIRQRRDAAADASPHSSEVLQRPQLEPAQPVYEPTQTGANDPA
jgi:hypothetical protein